MTETQLKLTWTKREDKSRKGSRVSGGTSTASLFFWLCYSFILIYLYVSFIFYTCRMASPQGCGQGHWQHQHLYSRIFIVRKERGMLPISNTENPRADLTVVRFSQIKKKKAVLYKSWKKEINMLSLDGQKGIEKTDTISHLKNPTEIVWLRIFGNYL